MDCCGFTLVFGVATWTIARENSLNTNVTILWKLLAKNWIFWKEKQLNSIAWAFYAPISSFLSPTFEVNSNSIPSQMEQLKWVFCYFSISNTRQKKGCDNLSFYKQHLEGNHQQLWKNWIDWKKEKLEMKRHPIKKGSAQPMAIFLYFLIVMLLVTKMVFNKCFLKMILCCWLLKRMCHCQ